MMVADRLMCSRGRCILRYLEAHGQEVAFEDGTYPGDYLDSTVGAGTEREGRRRVWWAKTKAFGWLEDVRDFGTDGDDGPDPRPTLAAAWCIELWT